MAMLKSEPKTGGDEEYQNQHFDIRSQRLNKAMRQMMEHKIIEAIKSIEDCLQQKLPMNDALQKAVTEFRDKLLQMYSERMEPSLNVKDAEVERIMKVPSNVLLPDGACQLEQVSEPEHVNRQDKIASLNIRIERATQLKSLLIAEEDLLVNGDILCKNAKRDMAVFEYLYPSTNGDEDMAMLRDKITSFEKDIAQFKKSSKSSMSGKKDL